MGKGQKTDNCGPESTDASNLLILMKNCKYYKPHITVYKNIEKVILSVLTIRLTYIGSEVHHQYEKYPYKNTTATIC